MQPGSNTATEGSHLLTKGLPILDKMYKDIDLRAVLVKSRQDEWHSAFLKIYFTKDSKDNVQNAHRNKESFKTITEDANLRLISECKDINEMHTILYEIEQGQIIINGIPIKLLSEESKNIYRYDLSSNENVIDLYTTAEQTNGYSQKFICLATDKSPSEILNKYGVCLTKQNHDIFAFLHPYLDTTSINSSNNTIVIIFPMYCKSLPLSDDEKEKYYKKLGLHNYLLEVTNILIEFEKEGKLKSINNLKLKDYVYKTESYDEMINVLLPKPNDPDMQNIDKIKFQIADEALGPIISDEIAIDKVGNVHSIASSNIELPGILKPYNIQIGSMYMGDVFQNNQNATIINRSNVQNAFNKIEKEHDEETSKALVKVAEFIENSKDPTAGVLFNSFAEELNKSQPDKFRLKSFWSGIEKALPTISTIAGTVAKIVHLFA
jgi:hypothetical protein